jgi:signal transduction histidine kinase
LPQPVSTAAFRVVQESLTNVMRHSGVKAAKVDLNCDGGVLFVRVTDQGDGFDQAALSPGQSTGLSAMRERAALLGGAWECCSAPGKGTAILLTLPLPKFQIPSTKS